MTKTSQDIKFKREKIDGTYIYVHRLPNGSKVHTDQKRTSFDAYTVDDQWLGFGSLEQMLICAKNGWHTCPAADCSNELTLWALWQDHLQSGKRVLEDGKGKQFIILTDAETVVTAQDGDHGWDVELTDINKLYDEYGYESSGPNDSILCLTVAKKPFDVC